MLGARNTWGAIRPQVYSAGSERETCTKNFRPLDLLKCRKLYPKRRGCRRLESAIAHEKLRILRPKKNGRP